MCMRAYGKVLCTSSINTYWYLIVFFVVFFCLSSCLDKRSCIFCCFFRGERSCFRLDSTRRLRVFDAHSLGELVRAVLAGLGCLGSSWPVLACLDLSELIWTYMDLYGRVSSCIVVFGRVCTGLSLAWLGLGCIGLSWLVLACLDMGCPELSPLVQTCRFRLVRGCLELFALV